MQHVFIVGAKSLGAYGGYETFVNKLTEYHQNNEKIKYHIACKANGDGYMDETKLVGVQKINDAEFIYHNAHCFKVEVPEIGSAAAIYYDIAAIKYCINYIKENKIEKPILYILACRIGPFASWVKKEIHGLGGKVFVNPDGHEWKRQKWSGPVRKYWKFSEKLMVKHADLLICDSINIENYIKEEYKKYNPKTTFIAYGSETKKSTLSDNDEIFVNYLKKKELSPKNYYLVVGRFVPENNFETMIKEFMLSKTKKDFAIITTANDVFLNELETKLHFKNDKRVKFVGTVYDEQLLKKLRENAFAYFHGHEVGGTNPSLLEALGSTDLNMLLDVGFNREVALDSAVYWTKEDKNLATLIDKADTFTDDEIANFGEKAKTRIKEAYSWEFISEQYRKIFKISYK